MDGVRQKRINLFQGWQIGIICGPCHVCGSLPAKGFILQPRGLEGALGKGVMHTIGLNLHEPALVWFTSRAQAGVIPKTREFPYVQAGSREKEV